MSKPLSDVLVVSDMDGTLLNPEKKINSCDLEAIRLFTMLGGNFTVASGRSPASVSMYPELTDMIKPAITAGGCILYDFQKNQIIRGKKLPHLAARQALKNIMGRFPALGAIVMGADTKLYQLHISDELEYLIDFEKMTYFVRPEEYLPETWSKVVLAGPENLMENVAEYTSSVAFQGLYFVRTSDIFLEMMPKDVSKGSALYDLCSILDIPVRNTYVVGDYFNDLDIMERAGYAVAMSNAPKEVKAVANEITDSNTNGGVGQFVYRLIRAYEA